MIDREIELKLEGDPEALQRLSRTRVVTNMTRGKASAHMLRSVYFDTPDFDLMNNGFALRVRKVGNEHIQTLKSAPRSGGPASDRGEWEHTLKADTDRPDLNFLPGDLRTRILALAGTDVFEPRFVSMFHRRATRLHSPQGGEIELAIDHGAINANGRESNISELELELKHGKAADLYRVALQLADIVPLRISMRSKAERGRALAKGEMAHAKRTTPVRIDPDASIEEAYSTILSHCLDHLMANQAAALDAASSDGLHQMRVALRRMRSALLVFGRVIDGEFEEELMRDAKWLTRAIGRARDYDVVVGDILSPALATEGAGAKETTSLSALVAVAQEYREEAWRAARAAMRAKRTTRFILRLALYLDTQGWREGRNRHELNAMRAPIREFAASALNRRFKSVRRLANDISDLAVVDRHELRKRLKKLRYTMSFFASLYPKEASEAYLHHLSNLQKVFGSLNDLETAQNIISELVQKNPRFASPCALLLERHEARATDDWQSALLMWREFRDEPLFWHH